MNLLVGSVWRARLLLLICLVVALIVAAPRAASAAQSIDINKLIAETQKQSARADRLGMVWWMPEQFWRATLEQDDSMTDAASEEFLSVLRPYVLVAALDGTIGPFGGATFVDRETLEKSITLVAGNGDRLSPLNKDQISPDARNFSMMMKPLLATMLGETGENLHFFFFPATTAEGDRIADAAAPGRFSVELGEEGFHWRLPLGSVLPPKVCPKDGEELNGAWTYCPWHGKKLVKQKEGGNR